MFFAFQFRVVTGFAGRKTRPWKCAPYTKDPAAATAKCPQPRKNGVDNGI